MKILVLTPKLPPSLDGIGDYAAAMAREWSVSDTVDVFTTLEPCAPIPGVGIHSLFDFASPASVGQALDLVRSQRPDWVMVQYNPFGWGRRGYCPWLPVLANRIRRSGIARVAVMVHERYVPLDTWAFRAMSLWQRPQLTALLRNSDQIFCSTELWIDDLHRRAGKKSVMVSTVGSNIPRIAVDRGQVRRELGIADDELVLGFFGFAHVSKPLRHLGAALERIRVAGIRARFLYVGGQVDAVRSAVGEDGLIAEGALPAELVSARFAAMDIHLCPFIDGISTRRGSMMTGLQHGIATVGTRGESTSADLRARDGDLFLLSDAADVEKFAENALKLAVDPQLRFRIAESGRECYEQVFAFPVVARKMRSVLANAEGE